MEVGTPGGAAACAGGGQSHAQRRSAQNASVWAAGWGPGWGERSSCPGLGDRKGLTAKQEKTKFPFPWFLGLVPAVGEAAGWGQGFLSPNLWGSLSPGPGCSHGIPVPYLNLGHFAYAPHLFSGRQTWESPG